MSQQSQSIRNWSALVRQHMPDDQKAKKHVQFQMSNGRKFYAPHDPYRSAKS